MIIKQFFSSPFFSGYSSTRQASAVETLVRETHLMLGWNLVAPSRNCEENAQLGVVFGEIAK